MRCNARIFLAVFVLATLLVIAAAASLYDVYARPGPASVPTTVLVPKGATVSEIASTLERSRIVSSAAVFRIAARIGQEQGVLQAGEYAFPAAVRMGEVLATLRAGDVLVRRLTVPEGLTSRQVVALVQEAEGLDGEIVALPVEGALLPETYNYSRGDSRGDLIRRMSAAMTAVLDELWAARAPGLPLGSPRDALILASIVEKETALPEERPRVAAVFLNRLRSGMRLQADPTVAYAVHGGGGGALSLADLQSPSPYNTYAYEGLPPGPIANPGRASIGAVLRPARSDELYFVADGSGGHAFSRSLDEHQRNVARWRRVSEHTATP